MIRLLAFACVLLSTVCMAQPSPSKGAIISRVALRSFGPILELSPSPTPSHSPSARRFAAVSLEPIKQFSQSPTSSPSRRPIFVQSRVPIVSMVAPATPSHRPSVLASIRPPMTATSTPPVPTRFVRVSFPIVLPTLFPVLPLDNQYLMSMAQFNLFVIRACELVIDSGQATQSVINLANGIRNDHFTLNNQIIAAAQQTVPETQLPGTPSASQQQMLANLTTSTNPQAYFISIMLSEHANALEQTNNEVGMGQRAGANKLYCNNEGCGAHALADHDSNH